MKTKNFKVLSIVLALVMALGLASVAVFADWPSFQNTNTNNGVITTAPPLDNPKTVLRVGLPTNDPYNPEWFSNSVWTGIDTTSVIKNGKAYTLYNGGVTPANNNTVGGARLGITDLATGAANSIQISAEASSGFQMSTPVIAGDDLYAAITKFVEFNANPAFDPANWTTPPTGLFFDGIVLGMYANSAGSVTTVTPDIYFPINMNTFTIELATSTSDGTDPIDYSIKLVDSGGLEHEIVPTMTAPAGMGVSVVTYNGATIPAGNYKLKLWVQSHSREAKVYSVIFKSNKWELHKVANFATNPVSSLVQDNNNVDIEYFGQSATPITMVTHNNEKYLYWGIYGGTKTYYQFQISNRTLTAYAPAGTEFYGAGAACVTIGGNPYVVFGSDSGDVHVRPVGANFGNPASGNSFSIGAGERVRSSIAVDGAGEYAYFTSNDGTNGKVHKATVSTLLNPIPTIAAQSFNNKLSTSTPVISDSGYVYFGVHTAGWPSHGGIIGTQASTFNSLFSVYGSAYPGTPTGEPVQASPIVYTYDGTDYIYFTTNSGSGKGYCYKYDGFDAGLAWQAGGASGNRYSMQGFASDNGWLVYGDDGGMLYIIK